MNDTDKYEIRIIYQSSPLAFGTKRYIRIHEHHLSLIHRHELLLFDFFLCLNSCLTIFLLFFFIQWSSYLFDVYGSLSERWLLATLNIWHQLFHEILVFIVKEMNWESSIKLEQLFKEVFDFGSWIYQVFCLPALSSLLSDSSQKSPQFPDILSFQLLGPFLQIQKPIKGSVQLFRRIQNNFLRIVEILNFFTVDILFQSITSIS